MYNYLKINGTVRAVPFYMMTKIVNIISNFKKSTLQR